MDRRTLLLVLALAACDAGAESRTGGRPLAAIDRTPAADAPPAARDTGSPARPADAASGASTSAPAAKVRAPAATALPAPRASTRDTAVRVADPGIVRGLYVNRWAAQSPRRMRNLIAIADTTEINALVLDLKDEFGLNYTSRDSMVQRNAGRAGVIPGLAALIDTMKAHGIIPIARLVVFKDSVAARLNPDHTILTPEGNPWRDREGLTWVNPYDPGIREYNIRVAEEMARLGFEEIQFDYIRFPEPYRSLPKQVFPGAGDVSKAQALAQFLGEACPRVRALGARCTADVFGLVTTVNGTLEVGQHWEVLARITDVLLPMVYPSHYPPGSFGVARPNAEPYRIVYEAIAGAHERNRRIGIGNPEHVRAWLQAFTLGQPPYGAEQIREQKRAVYDAGFDGWILWHPGSLYEQFIPALERETTSRKQEFTGRIAGGPTRPDSVAKDVP